MYVSTRRFAVLAVLALALALGLAACGSGDEEATAQEAPAATQPSGEPVTIQLEEQNGSGESGTATLTPAGDGKTTVSVELQNAPAQSQPAHIHRGSCDDLDPQPLYGLPNLENGKTETTIDQPLDMLTKGGLALNVHKSNDALDVYVACGNLPGPVEGAGMATGGSGY